MKTPLRDGIRIPWTAMVSAWCLDMAVTLAECLIGIGTGSLLCWLLTRWLAVVLPFASQGPCDVE